VDFDPQIVAAWHRKGLAVQYGDAEDPEFPGTLPLAQARGVICATPQLESNLSLLHGLREGGYEGQAPLNRYLLGSVSQKVLYEAPCSVRIARGNDKAIDAPLRIMIGTDGSPGADAAVKAVAARNWPAGTEARVMAALDTMMYVGETVAQHPVLKWLDANNEADRQ
jgi:hypothetical protein